MRDSSRSRPRRYSERIRGHLYDDQIKPDPGSTNPFLPGANRNANHRSFTVTMVDAPDPGPGLEAPNTVYGGVAGQAPGAGPMLIVVRVYLPDRGRDFTGGVGDPAASYVAPNGTTSTGQAACTDCRRNPALSNLTNVNPIIFPETKIQSLLALSSSPEHPAVKDTVWYKYFNPSWMLAPVLRRDVRSEHDLEPAPDRVGSRGEPGERVRVRVA